MRLLTFLEHIMKCSTKDDTPSDILHHASSDMREANIIEDFIAQLKKNNKAIG